VVIHVIAMRVLQSTVRQVVDVIAVGRRRVTAIRPVLVTWADDGPMSRIAPIRIGRRNFDHMLDRSTAFVVDQATSLEDVDMPLMTNGDWSLSRWLLWHGLASSTAGRIAENRWLR